MQFDTKDLVPGVEFNLKVKVIEQRDMDNERMAVFISCPDLVVEGTLFDVIEMEKINH